MQFDWWTVALQTVNFAVLVWLLHRFLYKPVLRMVDARRAEIENQFARAHASEVEAQATLGEVESEKSRLAAERTETLNAAARRAEEAAAARRDQAEQEADEILGSARKTIARERDEALAEARRAALDLGIEVARKLLDEVPTELRAEAWLEHVEQHLAGASPKEREEINSALINGGTVRAVTAMPLPESVMAEWRTRLRRALGDGVNVTFDVDPALIAGVELHLANAILHYSWRSVVSSLRTGIEAHDNHS